MNTPGNPSRPAAGPRLPGPDTAARTAPAEAADGSDSARSAVLNQIKKALVTSRLTLADGGAGGNPYDSGAGRGPGAVWRGRGRY